MAMVLKADAAIQIPMGISRMPRPQPERRQASETMLNHALSWPIMPPTTFPSHDFVRQRR